jgi:endoglucanase
MRPILRVVAFICASVGAACSADLAAPSPDEGETADALADTRKPKKPRDAGTYAPVDAATPVATPVTAPTGNPFAGAKFYVVPNSSPKLAADKWRPTRPQDAAQLDKIAGQPWAAWFGDWSGDVGKAVDTHVTAATAQKALPVLVAYDIPHRDCGNYSAGGAANAAAYRTWISAFANGIKGRSAVVVLEPDGLSLITCLSAADQQERYTLIAEAIETLAAGGKTSVYVDAATWVPAADMANRLTRAHVEKARGFSINVSNFESNAVTIAYGRDLSGRIGQKPFVIDTSRSGLGIAADKQWCNPPGRALGSRPTADTGDPLIDAFFWVKIVGESDGTCNGGPAAGTFWPEYALGLAQRAAY